MCDGAFLTQPTCVTPMQHSRDVSHCAFETFLIQGLSHLIGHTYMYTTHKLGCITHSVKTACLPSGSHSLMTPRHTLRKLQHTPLCTNSVVKMLHALTQ